MIESSPGHEAQEELVDNLQMRPCFLQHRFLCEEAGKSSSKFGGVFIKCGKYSFIGENSFSSHAKNNHVYSKYIYIYLQVLPVLLYSHRMDLMTRFKINIIIKLHFVYPEQYKQAHTNCSNCYIMLVTLEVSENAYCSSSS